MKRFFSFVTVLVTLLVTIFSMASCERFDDEPARPVRPITRLYVSTVNYQTDGNLPAFENIYVLDLANDMPRVVNTFISGARGGNRILFSPELRRVFHSAVNDAAYIDTAVRVLRFNEETGALAAGGKMEHTLLSNIRGVGYHALSNQAFLVNADANSSSLFVYQTPQGKTNPVLPDFIVPLDDVSLATAVFIRDLSNRFEEHNNITYISTVGQDGGIAGYQGITRHLLGTEVGTVVPDIQPDFRLTIPGSNSLGGMAYSPTLDLLVMTDYANNQGRLLFFENFSTYTTTGELTPSRVISGDATLLRIPRDVEIDTRENARYLYVADEGDRSVLRFMIDDEGNVAPDARFFEEFQNRTPVGISLDARGTLELEEEE